MIEIVAMIGMTLGTLALIGATLWAAGLDATPEEIEMLKALGERR